ncbi:hypothetical protein Fcan01_15826 [Folsomia candida]|uniref:Uncharacterized protein n=1 Tax=Folsomia candida TaxID=158441 RepID=A0A226DWX5_FOLCA|nr:hypothetical protein Fcan01_15826 [Folsomia candida]
MNDAEKASYAFYRFFDKVQLLSRPYGEDTLGLDTNFSNVDARCYRLLSAFPTNFGEELLPEFLSVLVILTGEFFSNLMTNSSRLGLFGHLDLFNPKHDFYPNGFSYLRDNITYSTLRADIERDVSKCGKTVFISKSTELKSEYLIYVKKISQDKVLYEFSRSPRLFELYSIQTLVEVCDR